MNQQSIQWNPKQWDDDGTFHIGINMAGAVSAGAYTAGVLDFLTEALEQWYAAKASENAKVPMHSVCIDVFSGASAGGMCAAIASVMLQGSFEHIRNPEDERVVNTNNRFYESWVNKIDIQWLLEDNDLEDGKPVISLLDSTIIDQIAEYALTPAPATKRPYVSDSLTLFLTLTNVRGTPYSLSGDASGSAEEDTAYYGDKLQFETVKDASARPLAPFAKPLPVGTSGGAWPLLQDAAKATGAFPLFLAPRKIDRPAKDYLYSPWEPVSKVKLPCVPAHWPLNPDDTFTTLNVDGGVTDNDPFQLAHDFLAVHNPKAFTDPDTGELRNPPEPEKANCAVLTVAPFPADEFFDPAYDFDRNMNIFGMLPNLFTTLVSQSRFLGESLAAVMSGQSCSRFVLAPSDAGLPNAEALQCGLLGAFGGFFERGFRAHDYQLGRRNCQKFLMDYFRLAIANPIMQAGLNKLDDATRNEVIGKFESSDPRQKDTLPIIPLCGT
ncbi:MAG: patatin-like phospholipase family protein, partial [Acidobacteriaceae bacterium]|nr:patatin-like phospholipase family protein [Acidobacteriaceae bacterium]